MTSKLLWRWRLDLSPIASKAYQIECISDSMNVPCEKIFGLNRSTP